MAQFETPRHTENVNRLTDRAAANLVLPRLMAVQKKARRTRVAAHRHRADSENQAS